MVKIFKFLILALFICTPAFGDSSFVAPTANGTAAVGQLPGTITNDAASAGNVGEIITATLASGSATGLVDTVGKTVITITLTPGDWDVWGVVNFSIGASTVVIYLEAGTSFVADTSGTTADSLFRLPYAGAGVVLAQNARVPTPMRTVQVAASTTTVVYLIAKSSFNTSTNAAWGILNARRVR